MSDPILYVEDSADDVFFMQRAFKKVNPTVDLRVITDGQQAADFFDPEKTGQPPVALSLVILDLNLPGRSGLEVLRQIRSKFPFAKVPVVLFTASSEQSDIDSCYEAGCNGYVVKPNNPEDLKTLISVIHDFWIKEN